MERIITVMNSRTQKKSVFNSTANTLGELKAEFAQNGIDCHDLEIVEGITKTQFYSDDSILPHDIDYKGEKTNNLIILLTNTKKKIKSGMANRKDLYAQLTPEMKNVIKERTGKNFTQVSSDSLEAIINEFSDNGADNDIDTNISHECQHAIQVVEPEENAFCPKAALKAILNYVDTVVDILYNGQYFDDEEYDTLQDCSRDAHKIMEGSKNFTEESGMDSPYSDKEIDDIMNDFLINC